MTRAEYDNLRAGEALVCDSTDPEDSPWNLLPEGGGGQLCSEMYYTHWGMGEYHRGEKCIQGALTCVGAWDQKWYIARDILLKPCWRRANFHVIRPEKKDDAQPD